MKTSVENSLFTISSHSGSESSSKHRLSKESNHEKVKNELKIEDNGNK